MSAAHPFRNIIIIIFVWPIFFPGRYEKKMYNTRTTGTYSYACCSSLRGKPGVWRFSPTALCVAGRTLDVSGFRPRMRILCTVPDKIKYVDLHTYIHRIIGLGRRRGCTGPRILHQPLMSRMSCMVFWDRPPLIYIFIFHWMVRPL